MRLNEWTGDSPGRLMRGNVARSNCLTDPCGFRAASKRLLVRSVRPTSSTKLTVAGKHLFPLEVVHCFHESSTTAFLPRLNQFPYHHVKSNQTNFGLRPKSHWPIIIGMVPPRSNRLLSIRAFKSSFARDFWLVTHWSSAANCLSQSCSLLPIGCLKKLASKAYYTLLGATGRNFTQPYQVQDPWCRQNRIASLSRERRRHGSAQNPRKWGWSQDAFSLPFARFLSICGSETLRPLRKGPK